MLHRQTGLKRLIFARAAIKKETVYIIPDQTVTIYGIYALPTPLPPGRYMVYVDVQSTDTDSTKRLLRFTDSIDPNNVHDVASVDLHQGTNSVEVLLSDTAIAVYMYASENYPKGVGDTAIYSDFKIVSEG